MANRTFALGCALAVVTTGLFCPVRRALAGPDWPEVCDAGSLTGTAQNVPAGTKSIRGKLNPCGPLAGIQDFEDMYQFTISTPGSFCARCVLISDTVDCCNQPINPFHGTSFNTQLWLFRSDGTGLLANDDESGGSQLSRLTNMATDPMASQVLLPGTYYLAISGGRSRDPISAGGLIFNQASLTEISSADGPGGASPITAWTGAGTSGPTIQYEIVICGTVAEIPTVSQWGLIVMTTVMLGVGMILIGRGRGIAAA